MQLLDFEVTNWGPHLHRKVTFDPNAKVIAIAGENDRGKSWIIRGIAGFFATGQNEYFDANAIFDGESEATLQMTFKTRDGKTHVGKRVIRKKDTEDKNEIVLDNESISPTKFNEFLREELGSKDPKVFLSMAVSMQGEAHFYLKAKKRDREEGLRSLSELDRIDAWKDHLSKIVSTTDKNYAQEKNTLLGTKATLDSQIKKAQEEISTLEKEVEELTQGVLPSGEAWILLEQIEATSNWKNKEETLQKLQQEISTAKRNLGLYQENLNKLENEIGKSPLKGLTVEAITEKEDGLILEEETIRRALIWKEIADNLLTIQGLENRKTQTEKEISDLQPLLTEEQESALKISIEDYDFNLRQKNSLGEPAAETKETLLAQKKKAEEDLETSKAAASKADVAKKALAQSKRILEASLKELDIQPPAGWDIAAILPLLKEKTTSLQTTILQTPISKQEANVLTQRVLGTWEKDTLHTCPISQANLETLPRFQSEEARTELLQSLQAELSEDESGAQLETSVSETLVICQTLLNRDIPALTEQEEEAAKLQAATALLEKENTLQTRLNEITEKLQSLETRKGIENKLNASETALISTSQKASPTEAKDLFQENTRRKTALETKKEALSSLKEQVTLLQAQDKKLQAEAGEKSPQVKMFMLSEREELTTEKEKISNELQTLRKDRSALDPLLRQETAQRTKINETEELIKTKEAESKGHEGKTPQFFGLLIPPSSSEEETTPAEACEYWENKAKQKEERSNALLRERPKVLTLQTEKKAVETRIDEIENEALDIAAASEITNFLDYKHAPRDILALTVDKIFKESNRMSKHFNLGMVLSQGKNLEFNVIQSRNGREVTQKTERLGFGKAIILGICTRISALKTLLPEAGFLILDEPSAHVDTLRKAGLRQFLQEISTTEGVTIPQILLVEHDQDVISTANQIIWID